MIAYWPMRERDIDWVLECEHATESFPWTYQGFFSSIESGHSAWLICQDGAPIGFALMMMVLDEAHLLKIAIMPTHQRQGLGEQFLEQMFVVAKEASVSQMFLEVRPSNVAARGLYEKKGFDTVGRRKDYYPAAEGREDALVMMRDM